MRRMLARLALDWMLGHIGDRAPDVVSDAPNGAVHMLKWHIIPNNRWFNIHLHQWFRSDDQRFMHDHQWSFLSWVLWGEFTEVWRHKDGSTRSRERLEGDVYFRHALTPHRVHIPMHQMGRVFTLLITGPTWRKWRVHKRDGASVPHDEFLAAGIA